MPMDEKLVRSLDTLLVHASRHCFRYRLVEYDFSPIKPWELRQVASSMLDHFETEMERLRLATSATDALNTPSGG